MSLVKLHEGGRRAGNSLMRDAGADQEVAIVRIVTGTSSSRVTGTLSIPRGGWSPLNLIGRGVVARGQAASQRHGGGLGCAGDAGRWRPGSCGRAHAQIVNWAGICTHNRPVLRFTYPVALR